MLRCFDCDAAGAADDARQLLDAGCWSSPKGAESTVIVTQHKPMATEYKRTFQDFSQPTRGAGSTEPDGAAAAVATGAGAARVTRAHTWYSQLRELRHNATCYKVRNWGKETAPDHLVYLYERAEDPSRPPERKIISALYLETLQPEMTRVDHERGHERGQAHGAGEDTVDARGRTVSAGGAAIRHKSAGRITAQKSGLRLHMNEKRTRPGSAQPLSVRASGGGRGRSPSAPRPPSAPTPGVDARHRTARFRSRHSPADGAGPEVGSAQTSAARGAASRAGADVRSPVSASHTPDLSAASAASGPVSLDSCSLDSAAAAALVRSPALPTRVRSPEAAMALHSPEPVNWTLPLDTARSFAVTHSTPPGVHKTHPARAKSRESPVPGQVSPLHKQLVNDQLARSGQPAAARAAAAAAHSDTPAPIANHVNSGGMGAAHHVADGGASVQQTSSTDPVPALVRPPQQTMQPADCAPADAAPTVGADAHQSLAGRPPGTPFFSGASGVPPPAAMVALFGAAAKPAAVAKPDAKAQPAYRII